MTGDFTRSSELEHGVLAAAFRDGLGHYDGLGWALIDGSHHMGRPDATPIAQTIWSLMK